MSARRFMMATTAIHKLGDISRDEPDLCVIDSETSSDYIGRWVEGFGFVEVRFPKATTRDLTDDELTRYDGMKLALWGDPDQVLGAIRVRPASVSEPDLSLVE